jgi:hypothetical protein
MEEHLVSALECLKRVALGDDTLVSASRALSGVLAASVAHPHLQRSFPAATSELCATIGRAAPALARAISGEILTEEVEVGMQAFNALLSENDDPDRPRQQLHIGLLSSQLNALHCRRELAKRRGPLPLFAQVDAFASQSSASVH